jgi:hypothetical protein
MSEEFYKVRMHDWEKGMLKFVDTFFSSFDEALTYASELYCDNFKIFDSNNNLRHSSHGKKQQHQDWPKYA